MASWIHAALWLFALWQDSLRSASNRCTQTILVRKASLKKKMMHWRLFEKRYKNLKISALSNWKIKRNRKLVRPFNVHTNRFVFLSNLVKDFQLNESLNEPLRFCNCQLEMSIRNVHSRCPFEMSTLNLRYPFGTEVTAITAASEPRFTTCESEAFCYLFFCVPRLGSLIMLSCWKSV